MRAAHAHHALIDIGARHALGLLVGRAHGFGGRRQLGDEPLAHSRRLHDAVAAIAQRALIHVGRQHARPRAAHVEHHDQVVRLLAHRAHPPCTTAGAECASRMRCGGAFPPCLLFIAARFAAACFFALCGLGLFRSRGCLRTACG